MRKEHNKKWINFDEKCQKLGQVPKIRLFLPDALVNVEGEPIEGERALVKTAADPNMSVIFTISTPGVKRDGHQIQQEGWHLSNYRSNPVVQWAHNYSTLPIARALWTEIGTVKGLGKSLRSEADFTETIGTGGPNAQFAAEVLRLYQKGVLNATSVGWRTIKYDLIRDEEDYVAGINFIEQELTEYSAVPVPADPQALQAAFNAGEIRSEFKDNFGPEKFQEDIFYIGYNEPERERKIYVDVGGLPVVTQPENREVDQSEEELRGVIPYRSYSLADKGVSWDAGKARKQLKSWATADGKVNTKKYGAGFTFVDSENSENLGAYKGPHHYVSGDSLSTVWRGVVAAAQRLQQGAFDVAEGDIAGGKSHIGKHYKDFGETAPWDRAIGRLYEQVHTDLKTANETEALALRETAIKLAIELYGETRLAEPWESRYFYEDKIWTDAANTIDSALAERIEDADVRELTVKEIITTVRESVKVYESSVEIIRQLFEMTGTSNSDELLGWIKPFRDMAEEQDQRIAESFERLASILGEEENLSSENNSENLLTANEELDNIMERMNANIFSTILEVSPVAGKQKEVETEEK